MEHGKIFQGGTCNRKLKALKDILTNRLTQESRIFAFPKFANSTTILHPIIGNDPRVQCVDLQDPSPNNPWNGVDVATFYNAIEESVQLLSRGVNVLFVCVGGKNRSRAAAMCAAKLLQDRSGTDLTDLYKDLQKPEDENMMLLVEAVDSEEKINSLTPFPTRTKRPRA